MPFDFSIYFGDLPACHIWFRLSLKFPLGPEQNHHMSWLNSLKLPIKMFIHEGFMYPYQTQIDGYEPGHQKL